jgi:hypothetical protein
MTYTNNFAVPPKFFDGLTSYVQQARQPDVTGDGHMPLSQQTKLQSTDASHFKQHHEL